MDSKRARQPYQHEVHTPTHKNTSLHTNKRAQSFVTIYRIIIHGNFAASNGELLQH